MRMKFFLFYIAVCWAFARDFLAAARLQDRRRTRTVGTKKAERARTPSAFRKTKRLTSMTQALAGTSAESFAISTATSRALQSDGIGRHS